MSPPDPAGDCYPPRPDDGTADRFGHLFNLIGDAVVEIELVETTPVVRAVNPAFEEVFGYSETQVLGESLNEYIIPDHHETEADTFDERTAAGRQNHAIVRRETATGVREFLYRGVPYEGADGRRFGFAIYSDITEQRTYERHIQVIHRILRHNLRNELSVILSAAQLLEAESDREQIEQRAAQISHHAHELASLGKEAQTLERVLTEDRALEPVDAVSMCTEAAEHLRERLDGTVTVDGAESLQVEAIPELSTAIEALIENGIVHNDDDPTVRVSARYEPKRAVIEIADDGPGIPASERRPVFERGDITQLQHGTGLGLWLARCTVEICDGQLEYERTENGWTVVRMVLRPG
ncbi:PAS domain S-box protein [Halovenus sp. WSH3]|uniref:histidine kinase n=1 Tax=Halovenus carboxidivorans TaxID=2692199 RepID=A0A6B0T473_9EURY|nr:PAS domain-containing sensor histidine kinase [Halovenus carboxidivorans]MXR50293.1 PAS domain S-box protein [Halovenus carboxidivorans]